MVQLLSQIVVPLLQTSFQANFIEYTAPLTKPPPYISGVPEAPFIATRGEVYFDGTRMIEIRKDYCIDIFPGVSQAGSCVFLNTNNKVYFIRNDTECCLFAPTWHPPEPKFLLDIGAHYVKTLPYEQEYANWFKVDIGPPTGPFYYSFDTNVKEGVYKTFAFPGLHGWISQNFYNVSAFDEEMKGHVFDVPQRCQQIDDCNFFDTTNK
jgi:hypothetical protein